MYEILGVLASVITLVQFIFYIYSKFKTIESQAVLRWINFLRQVLLFIYPVLIILLTYILWSRYSENSEYEKIKFAYDKLMVSLGKNTEEQTKEVFEVYRKADIADEILPKFEKLKQDYLAIQQDHEALLKKNENYKQYAYELTRKHEEIVSSSTYMPRPDCFFTVKHTGYAENSGVLKKDSNVWSYTIYMANLSGADFEKINGEIFIPFETNAIEIGGVDITSPNIIKDNNRTRFDTIAAGQTIPFTIKEKLSNNTAQKWVIHINSRGCPHLAKMRLKLYSNRFVFSEVTTSEFQRFGNWSPGFLGSD